ncbi:hypothetical protein GCM10008938_12810 [Deinococcus roseus]|uniref:Uncharacterized protein n=2 Tax=Deinococcus roseus TaxID=392414 RepID=A0ABQ2D0M7_9DEIO|nr:hypothetical protein GCM10008938_12810 [Deinococcus roseus]
MSFRPTHQHEGLFFWWEFDGVPYPFEDHADAPGVVFGWWTSQLMQLSYGARATPLVFFEGAPALVLTQEDNRIFASGEGFGPVEVEWESLASALQQAIITVAPAFEQMDRAWAKRFREDADRLDEIKGYRKNTRKKQNPI